MNKQFICPLPIKWNKIYNKLLEARSKCKDPNIPKPPIPLILAAWEEPHINKMVRWKETVEWAKKYGFTDLIPDLEEKDSYFG